MKLAQSSQQSIGQASLQRSAQLLVDALSTDMASLKGNLIGACNGQTPSTLMITSSKDGEGKTLAAIAIAQCLNNQGQSKVLIIDANARSPKLHRLYCLKQTAGLAELVLDGADQKQVCHPTSITNLDILGFGLIAQQQACLFESNAFQKILAQLSQSYNYIVVDADSVLSGSEVSVICPLFDGILLVIECESTKWQVVKIAADKISKAGGRLLGSIMNRRKFYIPRFFYNA